MLLLDVQHVQQMAFFAVFVGLTFFSFPEQLKIRPTVNTTTSYKTTGVLYIYIIKKRIYTTIQQGVTF